ncbi:MAG TPA: DUF5916 domain-containing protein [Thermoanaerobaculia bacterium]|nr:DUF5916 domain-containing protein [Thermoanaerobaculia bacterium]
MRSGTLVLALLMSVPAMAELPPPVSIPEAQGAITIDGDLSDAAWQSAAKFETWYEINPGDNVEPKVKTVGYVTYDRKFLYVAIESSDSKPSDIQAAYADHDQISGNIDDYAGIVIDTRNDGKSAYLFLVTARGVQYDAITDDAGAGEDSSPDFFWDSAARPHANGWSMEMRVPFSSLRYENANPEQWGLVLYRNWPRDRRYQMFTSKLPRDANCFVCSFGKITGLRGLPTGDHFVLAPYATTQKLGELRPLADNSGTHFVNDPVGVEAGLDFKWTPAADMAVDATINPDFSQIESDVAVISTNERFAIFIPEKRPFFLEGVELFTTPIQAVYTRTLTAPRWGARTTGKKGNYAYTLLVAQDRGGGSVIIPSAFGSDFAPQELSSLALIGRVRRDFGRSFLSLLATTRESEGGAHNRVFGPDFQWRIGEHHTLTGQLLFSRSETPEREDLHPEWNGQSLSGHAMYAWYAYSTATRDFFVNFSDYGHDFRADNGFVPQAGYRGSYMEAGHTFRPKGFFNRFRVYAFGEVQDTQDGDLLYRLVSAGFGADGRFRSFTRLRLAKDQVSNRGEVFDRDRLYYTVQFAAGRILSQVALDGWIGDEVDFVKNRLGRGANVNLTATLRPTLHLQIGLTSGLRWLNIRSDRLFTSQIERIRATYTFNSRMFLRAIVQNSRTNSDVPLYDLPPGNIAQHSGSLATQLLFAYKLNWQTVFYMGYGDLDTVEAEAGDFIRNNRQFFAKVSYAFQR